MAGVLLGPIQFVDREVPDHMPWGGKQMLAVHKQIGGARVIDAMGPDPHPIKWHGRFQGPTASQRARLVDALKDTGAQVRLSWGTFNYLVVVSEFEAKYEHEWQVLYSVCCEVVQSSAALSLPVLQNIINQDLSAATLGAAALGQIATAQAAIQAASAQAGGLANATLTTLQSLISTAQQAYEAVGGVITALPAEIDLDAITGASVIDGIATFIAEQGAVGTESDVSTALSYMGRVVSNLQLAGG